MPTPKLKSHERRRCAIACQSCKRRKEKCDSKQPCGRCVVRHVQDKCLYPDARPSIASEKRPVGDGPGVKTRKRLSSWHSCRPKPRFSTDGASPPPLNRSGHFVTDGNLLQTPGRRKGSEQKYSPETNAPSLSIDLPDVPERDWSQGRNDRNGDHQLLLSPPADIPFVQLSRLIQGGRGNFMFVGDAANMSLLQTIRRLVSQSIGSCEFTDDPLRHRLVEATPSTNQRWLVDVGRNPPKVPHEAEIAYLIRWYLRATNCVVNLFDDNEIHVILEQWMRSDADEMECDPMSAIFFLIFAVGAQAGPEDRDDDAERYFNYGRYLTTVSGIMEDPCISTVTANVLISMYLLGAARRNAAFMCLGTAVRAAYALGIHRRDISELSDPAQFVVRERLWKVLRVLDLFLSASLGRPPSTHETRDTDADSNYSASNDLCSIFEDILIQVYSKQRTTPEVLTHICQHHRRWAKKFTTGLAVDDIRPEELIDTDIGTKVPNIGLYHLKEAYYWTIMLLARPFIVQAVKRRISHKRQNDSSQTSAERFPQSNQIVAHACVDSAVRTVDLLHGLKSADGVPKRLPFVVNSLFVATLVLGAAQFGDLDQSFPIELSLSRGREVLSLFSRHDPVAKRSFSIVQKLQSACQLYLGERNRRNMELNSLRVSGLFGTLHANADVDKLGLQTRMQEMQSQADGDDDVVGLSQSFGASDPRSVYAIDTNLPSDSLNLGVDSLEMLPDLAGMTDLILPFSPSDVAIDQPNSNTAFFAQIDASVLQQEYDAGDFLQWPVD